jgi:hypothetical protein
LGTSIAVALAVACGSSSNSNNDNDAGDASVTDDSGAPTIPCNTAADAGSLCATGLECCMPMINILGLFGGLLGGGGGGGAGGLASLTPACVPSGTCTGSVMACNSSASCTGGMVCCAGTPTPDAGPEGGTDAGAAGGGALGGLGGLLGGGAGGLGGAGMTVCQTACMPGQMQRCADSTECTGGQTCQNPFAGFGGAAAEAGLGAGDAGAGAGAGGLGGLGGLLGGGAFTIPMSCAAPPAEGGIMDSSAPDTGVDTGTPTDAPAGEAEASSPDTGTPETGSEASVQEAGE